MGFVKTLKRKSLKIQNYFLKELSLKNKNIIISGSNSGIGLELTKKLLTENNILAFVNNETNNLDNLNNFNNLDIIKNNFEKNELEETSLKKINLFKPDILINCAASFGPEEQELKDINLKKFKQILNINVFGALQLINESLKSNNLKQIVNITSEMGSTANNKVGGYYYYRSSKSLLNSISKNLSLDLKNENINVFCIHPGDVKTKMNSGGLIMPDISAKKIINILSENNSKFSGILIDINKEIIKW
jgi:NAD(P)-dependent dehydrogenase (short-subunit alcohol dehydrogenase family)